MALLAGYLLYVFTILTTIAVVFALPVVLVSSSLEYLRSRRSARHLVMAACAGIGFVAGGFAGWSFRPFNWSMSFVETLRANYADHSIEHYAERVLLFVLMTSTAGAWVAGIATAVVTRWRSPVAPQAHEAR